MDFGIDMTTFRPRKDPQLTVQIERPLHSQESFNEETGYGKPNPKGLMQRLKEKCRKDGKKMLLKTFPIAEWLPRYNMQGDLPGDVMAGITAAILQIPQGLAYALLANNPAIVGVYTSVFPVIPYMFFGSSRHVSMGMFGVISLIVGRAVNEFANNGTYTYPMDGPNGTEVWVEYKPEEIGTHVTLLVAMWQILMYLLQVGKLCALFSDVLIHSFNCGVGVHIITSQFKSMLGIETCKRSGPFHLVKMFRDIIEKLHDSVNQEDIPVTIVAAVIVSVICIATSILCIYLIKPLFAKVTKIPFPTELVITLAGVIFSGLLKLNENYDLPIVGAVPKGLPAPVLPHVGLWKELLGISFVAAVVSYAAMISMALILARGEDYQVDVNQELLAMGLGNCVGSCFSCVPFAASVTRSIVSKNMGGKTQLANISSFVIIFSVLLWVADIFEPLPKAVLASVIVVAMFPVVLRVRDLLAFWRVSKPDALLWITTFLSVVLIDMDYGLLIGFALSAARVFRQGIKAYTCLLGNIRRTDLYFDIARYQAAVEIPGFKIVHYCGPLNYATRHQLYEAITSLTGLDPHDPLCRQYLVKKDAEHCDVQQKLKVIILDVSGVSFMDMAAAHQIGLIRDEYKSLGVKFFLAGCAGPIYEQLSNSDLVAGDRALHIYPTVHDAVQINLIQD